MKKTYSLLLLLCIGSTSLVQAQQKLALQSNGTTTIFAGLNSFVDAYNASIDGDTLYLSGGAFTAPANFDKKLVIFGAGHHIDSTLATRKTFINGNVVLSENADMFHLEGVEITGYTSFTVNHSVNNVTIKRCKINGTLSITGNLSNPSLHLSLIGNVFMDQINLANTEIALISNNIIGSGIHTTNGNLFTNNIFLNGYYNNGYKVFAGSNNQLDNNIIIYTSGINTGTANSYSNNLFVMNNPNYGTTPTTIDNYTGIPQADIFINQTGVVFDYTHNYHLQAPATYLGADGTEIGIYGGLFPYKEGAVPFNPHIQSKTIAPTTDLNGDLQIQIKVEAQDN